VSACLLVSVVYPSQQRVPRCSKGWLVWSSGDASWTCRLWSRAWWRQVSTVRH